MVIPDHPTRPPSGRQPPRRQFHGFTEEKAAADRRRQEEEKARLRARYLAALAGKGEKAWRDVEEQIELRNASGYDRAATLLADLAEIARTDGRAEEFSRRVAGIRGRHDRKGTFIKRLDAAGIG